RGHSAAPRGPFCVTCAPSRRRSASCSRWVAEWCARRLVRRRPSTFISTAAPTLPSPLGSLAIVDDQVAALALRVGDLDRRTTRRGELAGVAHLAAGLAIERRLVG